MQSAKLGNLGKENVQCMHLLRNQNLLEEICWGLPAISEDGGLIPWSLALGPWLLVLGSWSMAWLLQGPWLIVLVWLLVFGSGSLALGPCMALGSWLCMDGYTWLLHGDASTCAVSVLGSCIHGSGMHDPCMHGSCSLTLGPWPCVAFRHAVGMNTSHTSFAFGL